MGVWPLWVSHGKPCGSESRSASEIFISSAIYWSFGKRVSESDTGQPVSVPAASPAVPLVERLAADRPPVDYRPTQDGLRTETATDQGDTDDACSYADETENINDCTCPFARDVDVVTPFLPTTQSDGPSLCMIPSAIIDGSAPRIMVTVRSHEFPVMLDSGAELSVLPTTLAEHFQPPVQIPTTVRSVRTFGSPNVDFWAQSLLKFACVASRLFTLVISSMCQHHPWWGMIS